MRPAPRSFVCGACLPTRSSAEIAEGGGCERSFSGQCCDIGLARGFDPKSLAAIDVPVLVIAAGAPDPKLPAALVSNVLAAALPSARYVELAGAGHFSFLPLCKPGAVALLEEDRPGDGIVCEDGPGGGRRLVHDRTASEVLGFLDSALKSS